MATRTARIGRTQPQTPSASGVALVPRPTSSQGGGLFAIPPPAQPEVISWIRPPETLDRTADERPFPQGPFGTLTTAAYGLSARTDTEWSAARSPAPVKLLSKTNAANPR